MTDEPAIEGKADSTDCKWAERGYSSGLLEAARLADERAKVFASVPVACGAFAIFANDLRSLARGGGAEFGHPRPRRALVPRIETMNRVLAKVNEEHMRKHFGDVVKALEQIETQTVEPRCAVVARAALARLSAPAQPNKETQ